MIDKDSEEKLKAAWRSVFEGKTEFGLEPEKRSLVNPNDEYQHSPICMVVGFFIGLVLTIVVRLLFQ